MLEEREKRQQGKHGPVSISREYSIPLRKLSHNVMECEVNVSDATIHRGELIPLKVFFVDSLRSLIILRARTRSKGSTFKFETF